jgi:sugar phosphate permease
MILFGLGLTGLVTSLGGLFAVDIAPKRAAGAAMGVIGIFSYIGAAIQERVSGLLIQQNMAIVGADRIYDFGPAIWFWICSSIVSMLLAASLWRKGLWPRDDPQFHSAALSHPLHSRPAALPRRACLNLYRHFKFAAGERS